MEIVTADKLAFWFLSLSLFFFNIAMRVRFRHFGLFFVVVCLAKVKDKVKQTATEALFWGKGSVRAVARRVCHLQTFDDPAQTGRALDFVRGPNLSCSQESVADGGFLRFTELQRGAKR